MSIEKISELKINNKYQDLSKFKISKEFRGRSAIYTQIWWIVQATLIGLSPQPLYRWRAFWLKVFGAEIGYGLKMRPSARITYPWKVKIGNNTWIGDRAELYSLESIKIGNNVCISQDCYICTGSHDMGKLDFSYDCEPIVIDDEVWLASGCFVNPGVRIGTGAVVAARSVVTRSLEAGMVYRGQPAKPSHRRPCN